MAALAVAALASASTGATPTGTPPGKIEIGTAVTATLADVTCPGWQRAIGYYRRAYTRHREAMGLPGAPPRVWYGCGAALRRLREWRARAHAARVALSEWVVYNYRWREWLPDKWRRVASCETGGGGDPNWRHANGSYVSAFGISRDAYDEDAAHMGAPPWNDHDPPTPREQYAAALGHYDLHGGFDGWGCRGA